MSFGDEREHTLREVAALGNVKATLQLSHSGVNVNSQNAMNGWTALHWAAHRGHDLVVTALIRSGADPMIKTQKGQTALDLAVKHEAVMNILKAAMGETCQVSVGPEPELPIVPTYMKNPDLEKTWLLPDEFSENKVENIVRKQKAVEMVNNPAPIVSNTNQAMEQEREVLVYLAAKQDDNLLGSVYLRNIPIEETIKEIKEEIDGLPEKFSISRHNGKINVPINSKQYSKKLLDIFRSEEDVLIIIPQN